MFNNTKWAPWNAFGEIAQLMRGCEGNQRDRGMSMA